MVGKPGFEPTEFSTWTGAAQGVALALIGIYRAFAATPLTNEQTIALLVGVSTAAACCNLFMKERGRRD